MIFKSNCFSLFIGFILLNLNMASAQVKNTEQDNDNFEKLLFFDFRGTNTLEIGGGTSYLINSDVEDAEFGSYFRIGYKRSVLENLSIGLTLNSYNLSFDDTKKKLVSFDLGLEYLVLPFKRLSPYVYGGFGYNASSDYEMHTVKVQGGLGLEYIVTEGLGIKLFGEYNRSFEDDMEFLIFDENDDSFLRIGVGVNFYFGGENERAKRLDTIETFIKSNQILPDN